jgi:eukaryotic-like serine/threonine-protein kinase
VRPAAHWVMPGSEDPRFTRDPTTLRNESTIPELHDLAASASTASVPAAGRYVVGGVLGAGGMGVVHTCFDSHMGREVAMKLIRADRDATQLEPRFLAEARVQGSMEHPGIVPVHDLGRDAEGRAFFTMKHVRGVGLDVILARIRRGDADATREYPPHRLLTAFAQICLTVDFAHGRGVSHRDLKPANVMLGDHGEVYVLDWGIAKVRPPVTDGDETQPAFAPAAARTLVGTLGYAAPELVNGGRGDPLSDVFSLGAILFEILACEPLVSDDSEAFRFLQHPGSVERRPRLRAPAR